MEHKIITDPNIHEPKGVSGATAGSVYTADGSGSGVWTVPEEHLPSDISIERVLDAYSTLATQNPTGLGEANATQITFGAAANTGSDPVNLLSDGTLEVNESGLYRIKTSLQFGRTGASGTAGLLFRVLLNGTQAGRSVYYKLANADSTQYFENDSWVNLTAGTEVTFEVMREDSGNNSGGLVGFTPTGSWNTSSSASLRVERWV